VEYLVILTHICCSQGRRAAGQKGRNSRQEGKKAEIQGSKAGSLSALGLAALNSCLSVFCFSALLVEQEFKARREESKNSR
jgi:hypothetical protein